MAAEPDCLQPQRWSDWIEVLARRYCHCFSPCPCENTYTMESWTMEVNWIGKWKKPWLRPNWNLYNAMNLWRLYLARWNLRTVGGKRREGLKHVQRLLGSSWRWICEWVPFWHPSINIYNLQANPMLHRMIFSKGIMLIQVSSMKSWSWWVSLRGCWTRALKIPKEVACQYFSRVTHRLEEAYHPNFPPKNCPKFPL